MFAQFAKALADVVVNEVVRVAGDKMAETALTLLEATETTVTKQGDEITVELRPEVILGAAVRALTTVVREVAIHPRVVAFWRRIPDSVKLFFKSFRVGVARALYESISIQLFNETLTDSEGMT